MNEQLPYRPCVGITLFNENGHVFVGERLDNPGAWQMPQGGIDQGETTEDAFFREMKEEIGTASAKILKIHDKPLRYDLPPYLLGKLWGGRWGGQEQIWIAARFTGAGTLRTSSFTVSPLVECFDAADERALARLPPGVFEDRWLRFLERTWPLHVLGLADELFGDAAKTIPLFVSEWGWSSHLKNIATPFYGTRGGYADPLRTYLEERPQISWTAWSYDPQCGPAMTGSDKEMGEFVRQWLEEYR